MHWPLAERNIEWVMLLGLIGILIALIGALASWLWGLCSPSGRGRRARQRVAGVRWFHWLLVCGLLAHMLGLAWESTGLYRSPTQFAGLSLLLFASMLGILSRGVWYPASPWVATTVRLFLGLFTVAGVASLPFLLLFTFEVRGEHKYTPEKLCSHNIKSIVLPLAIYREDHDGKLPQVASWQEEISPYGFYLELARCPVTGKPYVYNGKVAGKTFKEITQAVSAGEGGRRYVTQRLVEAEVPLIWEQPADDGRAPHKEELFNVGFFDGHVGHLSEAEFSQLMQAWGTRLIPP